MDRQSLIFCVVTLGAALAVSAVGFRYAALPPDVMVKASTPVTPDKLPDFDLGPYGRVSGIDLMGYWMDHPPAPAGGAAPADAVKRFGGC